MIKKKVFDIADSNIENIGSAEDKEARLAAAKTETAWAVAGKEPGLQIWRIEKFLVKPSKTAAGTFYSDDSYIILNTYTKKTSQKLLWDVHFWIGSTSSQDEYGTAAYKTVELDDYLGGDPVQHREVMSYESPLFLSYFEEAGGIMLLEGGVESGFNHVSPTEYKPRLLHIKGRKNVRVSQVPLEAANLNEGDVFVLDAGLNIYEWSGKNAGINEKKRGGIVVRAIRDEREGKPKCHKFAQGDKDSEMEVFWELLGGEPKSIKADAGGDESWEKDTKSILFQLSDASGDLVFKEVGSGKVKRKLLDSNDVFIFDIGCEVFVWIGKNSSKKERSQALHYAQQYLVQYKRPQYLPITRILDGGENELFESSFTGSKINDSGDGVPTMYTTYYDSEKKEKPVKPKGMGSGKVWKRPAANQSDDLPSYLKEEKPVKPKEMGSGKEWKRPASERPKDIPTTGKKWTRPAAKSTDTIPTLFKMDPMQTKLPEK